MKALVTVTNAEYIEGTEVLFHSFLRTHPGFRGDFAVIHNGLSKALQERLLLSFPVTFIQVSTELKNQVSQLVESQPQYANRHERFWSLEAFNLNKYDALLYMDSDTLCRKNFVDLFELDAAFAAAPDLGVYEGIGRDPDTFEKVSKASSPNKKTLQTFNAGVLFLRPKELPAGTFDSILELVSPEAFAKVMSGHTDQYVLNRHFHQKVYWLSSSYNFLITKKEKAEHGQFTSPEDAFAWHYIRHPKPWKLKKLVKYKLSGQLDTAVWKEWHQHYRRVLWTKIKKGKDLRYFPHWILSYVFAR